MPEAALPQVVRRIADRINSEPRSRAAKPWTATYLLMGLRYSDELTDSLLEGVQNMHESTTYEKILRDGGITEARRMLLRLGRKRFRDADAETVAAVEAIKDVDRLETLGERILDPEIHDWAELLQTP